MPGATWITRGGGGNTGLWNSRNVVLGASISITNLARIVVSECPLPLKRKPSAPAWASIVTCKHAFVSIYFRISETELRCRKALAMLVDLPALAWR